MKILSIMIGYIFMVVGFTYILMYTNLFSFGYDFYEYFNYISTRYECYLFLIGLIMIVISLFRRKK